MNGKSTRGARVRAVVGDPWIAVPERLFLAETGLTVAARFTLIYVLDLARRPGWTIYVAHIQRQLGLSRDRWRRIRKELQKAGYYFIERGRDDGGRVTWEHTVYDRPQSDAQTGDDDAPVPSPEAAPNNPTVDSSIVGKTTDGESADGQAIAGESDGIRSTTSRNFTKRSSSKHPHPSEHSNTATLTADGDFSATSEIGNKRRRTHACGIVYWLDDELGEIDILVARYGEDVVRKVADGLFEQGLVPYQSRVAVVLAEQRARARREERQKHALQGPSESSTDSARKLMAEMRAAGLEPSDDLLASACEQTDHRKE